MKKFIGILTMCFISFLFTFPIEAGTFVSGSTGADGPFNPPAQVPVNTVVDGNTVTVPLPPDGIFNFTTVDIPAGITVKFQKNASNTPVNILTTGDVNIAGTIDINGKDGAPGNIGNIGPVPGGKGGPGGFDGGYGGEPESTGVAAKLPGNGIGPGGGKAGSTSCTLYACGNYYNAGGGAGFGSNGAGYCAYSGGLNIGGVSYGSPTLLPLVGGSGGGGGYYGLTWSGYGGGGAGGGGAILIASSTKITITGSILANGGSVGLGAYNGGGGSGGAIRLVSNVISGNGSLQAAGVAGSICDNYNTGGVGRVRLEGYTVTLNNSNPYPSVSTPSLVFLPQVPKILITKIAGNTVPASASGSYSAPDITLPSSTTNPISVEIAGTNIPVGSTVQIDAFPQNGAPSSTTATLTGTDASSTATASLSISTTYPSIITAQTTFTVQTAMFYDGEKINKVRVASSVDGKSEAVYLTESGKEIKAEKLILAGLLK